MHISSGVLWVRRVREDGPGISDYLVESAMIGLIKSHHAAQCQITAANYAVVTASW